MSDENQAALVEPIDAFVQGDDQTQTEATAEATSTESAPVEANEPVEKNGVQERINKITADKHDERRKREAEAKRADDLQKQLDEYKANKPTLTKPTLEDHEFDEDAFNKADVAFQVQEQVAAEIATQKAQQEQSNQKAKMQESLATFNERATALGKDDFDAKASGIPELPAGVADAIMDLENGAEMVYHLGTHLDKADALANMTPMAAMMELGKLSASMSVKPEIKTSAAPDPIEPVTAGSALSSEIGDDMPIEEWMAKFG